MHFGDFGSACLHLDQFIRSFAHLAYIWDCKCPLRWGTGGDFLDFTPPDHLTLKPGLELFAPNWWNSVKCENGALAAVSAQLRPVVVTVFLKFYKHNPGP